jgi:flagellar motor component MotA
MMRLLGVIFFLVCIVVVCDLLVGSGRMLDLASLGLVVIPPFLIAVGTFGLKNIIDAFWNSLSSESVDEERRVPSSLILKSISLFTVVFGIVGGVVESLRLLAHLDELKDLPHGLGVLLLPPLYALILTSLVYFPLSKRLEG